MKPAPFRYHAPKTIEEAVADPRRGGGRRRPRARRRPEPRADHGVSPGAAGASRRHQRRRRAAAARGRRATSCRSARACAMPRSTAGRRRSARAAARQGRAPYRALSDPHARHVLRQPRACRSRRRNGAWWRRRSTPRWWRGSARGTRTIPARDFFRGHHDDGARRGRAADRGAAADPARRHRIRLLRVQPPRRRFRARHGAGRPIASRTA